MTVSKFRIVYQIYIGCYGCSYTINIVMIGLYIFFLGCLMFTFGKLITMNATIRKLTTSKFLRPAITSESNEKVKFIRSLTQKKKRDSSGTVLLEGFR